MSPSSQLVEVEGATAIYASVPSQYLNTSVPVVLDIRYAGYDNICRRPLYGRRRLYLRP